MKEPNPQQRNFIAEYLVDYNATKAAERAGYSKANSSRIGPELLGKPWIAEAIRLKQLALSHKTEITAEFVLERLKKEATNDGEGSSASARVKALELLGKHLGMFIDRVEHSGVVESRLKIVAVVVDASARNNARDRMLPESA